MNRGRATNLKGILTSSSGVAQRSVRRPYKPEVAGSSPAAASRAVWLGLAAGRASARPAAFRGAA